MGGLGVWHCILYQLYSYLLPCFQSYSLWNNVKLRWGWVGLVWHCILYQLYSYLLPCFQSYSLWNDGKLSLKDGHGCVALHSLSTCLYSYLLIPCFQNFSLWNNAKLRWGWVYCVCGIWVGWAVSVALHSL